MRKTVLLVVSICLSLSLIEFGYAGSTCQMSVYSVDAPNGWDIQKENDNKIVFVSPDAKFENIYISVSASTTKNKLDLHKTWEKMKPLLIENNDIIFDGEEYILNNLWKKTIFVEKHYLLLKYKKTIFFTIKNNTKLMVQFNCPNNKYNELLPVFTKVISSIIIK